MLMTQEKKIFSIDDIEGDYATKKDIASILKVSIRTVERLIASGELPAKKLSPRNTRISKQAFTKFLEEKK